MTYTNEANSQFAKEAMAHQSLDHNEILNVRWATVDPNPMAQAREARKIEEQAAEAVRRALPAEFIAEIEGRDPEARKRKRIEGSFGLPGYEPLDEVWYARQIDDGNPVGQEAIDAPGERLLVENTAADDKQKDKGGILSQSTLQALQGYSIHTNGGGSSARGAAISSGGPLVTYGSDDDDD